MTVARPADVLLLTDRLDGDEAPLVDVLVHRARLGPIRVRLLLTNPARSEFHLLHPERRDAAGAARPAVDRLAARLAQASGCPVQGSVSIRHDPLDALEEDLFVHSADELVFALHEPELSRRLHHDLQHRARHLHLGLPITAVPARAAAH